MGTWLDQHGAAVHHRVAIIPDAIFRRHFIIGDAFFRQHRAAADILAILIGRPTLFDHIAAETRALIDAQDAGNAADDTANRAADNGAHGTGCALALAGAAFDASGDALRLGE